MTKTGMSKRGKSQKQATREKVRGAALLLAFIEKHEISYRFAAQELGVKHPAVLQWVNSVTIPLERYREAIEIWTSGAVPAGSWLRKVERSPVDVQPFKPSGTES